MFLEIRIKELSGSTDEELLFLTYDSLMLRPPDSLRGAARPGATWDTGGAHDGARSPKVPAPICCDFFLFVSFSPTFSHNTPLSPMDLPSEVPLLYAVAHLPVTP
jgi:hypothetical protein